MISLILFLATSHPARADVPHVPAEMQQKYQDISAALRESYRNAQAKLHKSEKDNDVVHTVVAELGKFWGGVKAGGKSALIYLDHQLHEHVIGTVSETKP